MQFCAKARRKVFNEMTTYVKYRRGLKRVHLVETQSVSPIFCSRDPTKELFRRIRPSRSASRGNPDIEQSPRIKVWNRSLILAIRGSATSDRSFPRKLEDPDNSR